MRHSGWIGIAAIAVSAPAYAGSVPISAPAGSVTASAIVIARQTGSSIIITDPEVAQRNVPAIRGRFTPEKAVERLARAAGARAVPVGAMAWRLVPLETARPARRQNPARRDPTPVSRPIPESGPSPDIVVTGSKRETVLADYAGQAEMVRGEELVFGGVGGTEKLIQRIPTVASTYLGSGRNKLFIRGIADSSFTGPTQATVGQYFGDLRLTYNAPDPDLRLSDLASVEVLEGPQGTLYGAGSLGGIIRLVPNEPDAGALGGAFMLGGSATQHGALGGDASATANVPLADGRAALRFTINAETQGGYIDKPLLGERNVNRTDIYSGRAMLRVYLSPDWTVDFAGIAQKTDGHDSQYADRDGDRLTRSAAVTEGFDAHYAQGQIVLTGRFGDVRFKSSTGVTGQNLEERYDATPEGGDIRLFVQQNDTAMIANETRLWQPLVNRVGWVIGGSYTHNRTQLTRTLGPPGEEGAVTGVTNITDEFTLYGEVSVRLAENLIATGGARFTHSRLSGAGEDVDERIAAAMSAVTASRSEEVFLPSGSLAANVLPDTTIYIRYQEGFRPGGLAVAGNFVSRFRNDRIGTFELGARHGRAGRGPFDLAGSVAYTRWSDIQADFIDSAGFPSTANIGDGRIWTLALSGSVELTPDLRLDGGVTYNDGKIDEPPLFLLQRVESVLGVPVFSGDSQQLSARMLEQITQVPNVARFSGRFGFDYRTAIGHDLELKATGWANYVGRSRLGVGPELGEPQGNYLDTGLTVRVGRDALGVTLGLTNLTDEEGNRFALGTPFTVGRSQITPLRPRTIRIGLDAAF